MKLWSLWELCQWRVAMLIRYQGTTRLKIWGTLIVWSNYVTNKPLQAFHPWCVKNLLYQNTQNIVISVSSHKFTMYSRSLTTEVLLGSKDKQTWQTHVGTDMTIGTAEGSRQPTHTCIMIWAFYSMRQPRNYACIYSSVSATTHYTNYTRSNGLWSEVGCFTYIQSNP